MTVKKVLEQLLSNISDEFDKTVGSFFYDAEKPIAIELADIYDKLDQIVQNGYARTAKDEWLEIKVSEQGLTRRDATFATGTVTITGDDGAQIPLGTKVASMECVFSTTEFAVIVDGTAKVAIKADAVGIVGNVPAGAINRFPVTVARLLGVTNENSTNGGYDIESDDSLRERYFEKVTQPATSGNVYHYRQWAHEVVGVGEVGIIPLWNGNGTVKIIITDANGGPAPSDLVDALADYIEEVRPIGATVTVVSATPVPINISVRIIGDSSQVAESVSAYLATIQFGKNAEVSYAKIGKAILSANGVADWRDLLINSGDKNIPLTDEEVAVLGTLTIT